MDGQRCLVSGRAVYKEMRMPHRPLLGRELTAVQMAATLQGADAERVLCDQTVIEIDRRGGIQR